MLNTRVDVFPGAVWSAETKREIRVPSSTEAQQLVLNTLLDSALHNERRSPLDWGVSLALHGLLIAGLVIAPLLFTQAIDLRALQLTYLVAPMPPAAAPPPPPAVVVQKLVPRKLVPFNPKQLVAPSAIPQKVVIVREPEVAPEVGSGVIGGIGGGAAGGVLGGIIGGTTMPAAPPVTSAPDKKEKQVLRVGGDVQPPRKLYSPAPKYPALAESAHVHGAVLIEATINEKGDVVNARAIQGHPLLLQEALRTVMLWKYAPTYLNGVPFPVEMTVTVNFSFAS
jgi:protein TonB